MSKIRPKVSFVPLLLFLGLELGGLSALHSDPIFVSRGDTTVCEGDSLVFSIFADAVYPGDQLDFEMDEEPEGAELENLGKCG